MIFEAVFVSKTPNKETKEKDVKTVIVEADSANHFMSLIKDQLKSNELECFSIVEDVPSIVVLDPKATTIIGVKWYCEECDDNHFIYYLTNEIANAVKDAGKKVPVTGASKFMTDITFID